MLNLKIKRTQPSTSNNKQTKRVYNWEEVVHRLIKKVLSIKLLITIHPPEEEVFIFQTNKTFQVLKLKVQSITIIIIKVALYSHSL